MSFKIFVLASEPRSLAGFRLPLLEYLQSLGLQVVASAPELSGNASVMTLLKEKGFEICDAPLKRTAISPLDDVMAIFQLARSMRRERISLFFGYTIKPVIYGSIAAWAARVPRRYAMITGLGYAFGEGGLKRRLLRWVVLKLYQFALSRTHGVIFQNPDDAALFQELGLTRGLPTTVVNGSGVDLESYQPADFPCGPMTFLVIARLLKAKGIREFAKAAGLVRERYPKTRFVIVGGHDRNPDAIDAATLKQITTNGIVDWVGEQSDVRPWIAESHVFVLASYREGTPRSTLEAMAMARPVITTDVPGCRETVIDGINGILVPARDERALAQAMLAFVRDPSLVERMGSQSLLRAQQLYDVRKVNIEIQKVVGL